MAIDEIEYSVITTTNGKLKTKDNNRKHSVPEFLEASSSKHTNTGSIQKMESSVSKTNWDMEMSGSYLKFPHERLRQYGRKKKCNENTENKTETDFSSVKQSVKIIETDSAVADPINQKKHECGEIESHLCDIFNNSRLNDEEIKPVPFRIKTKEGDTPVIIGENGFVAVIYKPEKVKIWESKESLLVETNLENDFCFSPHDQQIKRKPKFKIRKNKKYPPIKRVKYKGKMVYKCQYCEFFHPKKVAELRRHMVMHQPVEWFYCYLCDYKAKRKCNLKVHMLIHRNPDEVVWYKCEMCEKRFKHKTGLNDHVKRHLQQDLAELYSCEVCPYRTPFKHTLLRHMIIHEPVDQNKLLNCKLCSYTTNNKYYLARHKQTHEEPSYKCLQCSYEAKYKGNLESHMNTHNRDEMFFCVSCDFVTSRRYTLKLHNRKVHKLDNESKELYYCYSCSFQTRFKRCLVKHLAIHYGIPKSKEDSIKIKTEVSSD